MLLFVENLKKQIVEAHRAIAEIAASSCTGTDTTRDDYLEARIKFLQHQVNDKELYIIIYILFGTGYLE